MLAQREDEGSGNWVNYRLGIGHASPRLYTFLYPISMLPTCITHYIKLFDMIAIHCCRCQSCERLPASLCLSSSPIWSPFSHEPQAELISVRSGPVLFGWPAYLANTADASMSELGSLYPIQSTLSYPILSSPLLSYFILSWICFESAPSHDSRVRSFTCSSSFFFTYSLFFSFFSQMHHR